MADIRRRPDRIEDGRVGREFRFSPGSGSAAFKLLGGLVLTALLIVSFAARWPGVLIGLIGLTWAIVVGAFIVAPMISSGVADALNQQGRGTSDGRWRRGIRPEGWTDLPSHPLRRATDIGLHNMPTKGPMARPSDVGTAPGFDWVGLMMAVASRLEDALGDGFTAEAESGASIMLRHGGDMSRKVNVGQIFQPPPIDVSERAMRGCLKLMDEAQMFAMRVHHVPWPTRNAAHDPATGNLPRPQVRFVDGEIRMSWADSAGTVLQLAPLLLDKAPPGDPGIRAW